MVYSCKGTQTIFWSIVVKFWLIPLGKSSSVPSDGLAISKFSINVHWNSSQAIGDTMRGLLRLFRLYV